MKRLVLEFVLGSVGYGLLWYASNWLVVVAVVLVILSHNVEKHL